MKATINRITLAYDDQGKGIPLVFLHAFPLNRRMWDPQTAALSGRFRVITVDLRGHGESDSPLWHYSLDQAAEDVVGLLDHLSIEKAVFVGLSMGGYVCFSLYRSHAARVLALVLADTRAGADTDEGRIGRFEMAQTAYRRGAAAIADVMIPKLLTPRTVQTKPDLVQLVRAMIQGNQISGIAGDLMAMAERPDSLPILPAIACPTLVLVGQEDVATPPSEARLMAGQIPGARVELIPEAGHLSNLERPDLFNRMVEEFAAGLGDS